MEKNFGFGFEVNETVDLATSYEWEQMLNLAYSFINEARLYEPDEVIEATLKEYEKFKENFDLAQIDLLTDDFWNWYDFHYANTEMLPPILNYFAAIVFTIDSTREELKESYLDDLYDIYQRILPYIPPKYLA